MKNFSKVTKRSLSLFIAAILLCASVAIPVSAADYSFDTAPSTYNITDCQIGVSLASATNGLEFKFCAVPASVSITSISQLSASTVKWFGSTANSLSSAILTMDYTGAFIGAKKTYKIYPMAHNIISGDTTYTIDRFAEVTTLDTAPRAPLASEITFVSSTYDSLTFQAQPEAVQYSTNLVRWYDKAPDSVYIVIDRVNSNNEDIPLTHSTSYDCYFRLKAVEGQAESTYEAGKVLKITASTTVKPPHATPAAPATSDTSLKADTYFSVVYLPGHTYFLNGKEMKLQGTSRTDAGKDFVIETVYNHQEIIFINLTPDTPYTVTCIKNANDDNSVSAMSPASPAIRTKRVPSIPATPTTKEVSDTKVIFNYTSGVEYALIPTATPNATPQWVKATENADGSHVNAYIDGLTPGTSYSAYARVYETSETVASAPTIPVTIVTKLSAKKAPELTKINVTDKSTSKIILQEIDGIEFRIGKTGSVISYSEWQASGVFANLTINTNYTIQARYTYNPATQMPSEIVSRTTITSSRIPYAAGINKTLIKRTDSDKVIRGGDVISITATGDTYTNVVANNIMGDTRLVPVGWYSSENPSAVVYFETPALAASFRVTAVKEGTLTVFVIYENQKWMGTEWKAVKDANDNPVRVEGNISFTVKATRTPWTNIADFFVGFINIFTNTIPTLILRIFAIFA